MGEAGPGVGVGVAKVADLRVEFSQFIWVDLDYIPVEFTLSHLGETAFSGAWLSSQNDSPRMLKGRFFRQSALRNYFLAKNPFMLTTWKFTITHKAPPFRSK
ncbi:hypothetical protein SB85_16710 [Xanthomonas sacchari]|nr:hypothetical protein SB85_16710 [Xanthomonas sacchari]